MGALFGQAIAAFQGFFSRGFWFGAFLPVAITAAINAVLIKLTFHIPSDLTKVESDKWFWSAPIAAALIVAAYALAPLVPLCRAVLDGRLLPDFLFEWLRRRPVAQFRRAEAQSLSVQRDEIRVSHIATTANLDLPLARTAGDAVGALADPAAIRSAVRAVRDLEARRDRGKPVGVPVLESAVALVRIALNRNAPALDAELNYLDSRILAVLEAALADVTARRIRQDELSKKRPEKEQDVQATAIGNARSLSEFYSRRVYRVDFEFMWSRVQMVVPDDAAAAKRIEAARALVDFAVLSLVLAAASVAAWLPILARRSTSPWPFLLLGTLGPLFLSFLYQLVVASQTGLGELAQGIVDKYRFDVFKMLHIKPPVTLSEERRIWSSLSAVARGDRDARDADFIWTHPP